MRNIHKGLVFHTEVKGLTWGKTVVQWFELQAELVTFLMVMPLKK